ASPPGTGPWPAVVMIHEIFGLDDVMRGHADRLADLCYFTLAVDLLSARAGYDAAAVTYGQLPRHLHETLAGPCPIVASYGRRDPSLRGAAARLDAALDKAGVTHDVKEYPAASHAFLNDAETGPHLLRPLLRITGIGPEPDSAKDAWDRIERFFA